MKKNYKSLFKSIFLAPIFLLVASVTFSQISGNVFRDYNGDATKGTTSPNLEPNVPGVIINAYNASDAIIASYRSTSAVSTNYSIPSSGTAYNGTPGSNTGFVPNATAVRLEFIIPNGGCAVNPFTDFTSFGGVSNRTSVQFVSGGATNVNYPINDASDYVTNTNPFVFVPLLHAGDPLGGGTSGSANDQIVRFSYNISGNTTPPTPWVSNNLIGAIWGQAYSKPADRLFFSAIVKRQHGLGPLGSGGIYLVNPNTTNSVTNFYNLDANGYATRAASGVFQVLPNSGAGSRNMSPNVSTGFQDPTAFAQAGKTGIGDLDITNDGKTIVLTNLFDRGIYRLTLNNAANPTGVSAVNRTYLTVDGTAGGTPLATATQGVLRPWGISIYQGFIYVGVVASGETRSPRLTDNGGTPNLNEQADDLVAYVYKMNLATGAWVDFNTGDGTPITPVVSIPLNYTKGRTSVFATNSSYQNGWNAWTDDPTVLFAGSGGSDALMPQPILSDIDFDDNGSIILSFTDRTGHQQSWQNWSPTDNTNHNVFVGGDVLRVGFNNSTCTYTVENNANDGNVTTAGANNGQGRGSSTNFGEFYYEDNDGNSGTAHNEAATGASTKLRGDDRTLFTVYDPTTPLDEIGVAKYSGTTGASSDRYQIIYTGNPGNSGTESKGNGLGDIELIEPNAPIEIGNRIWNDANGDGIQEPGEASIAGVALEIFLDANNDGVPDGAAIGTVTTDANGNYIFSSATGTNATGVAYGIAITPNQNYIIRPAAVVWNSATGAGTGVLAGYKLTKTSAIGSGAANLSDNDASLTTGATIVPQIRVTTGVNGQNNHNLDFGLTKLASLGNRVWLDEGAGGGTRANGVQDGTEPGVAGVPVNLYQNGADGLPGTADDVLIASTITDAYGNYLFENLQPSTGATTQYNVRVTPPANYSITTQTNTTDDNNTTGPSTTGSDVNVLGVSYSIDLSAGENNPNIDAGLIFNTPVQPNSIGDRVWFDTNGDGNQDAGEPGVAGVTVTLYDAATGNIVAITTTDANGNYLFNNLPANTNYQVGFSAPAGTVLTTGGTLSTGNATTNSDPNPATGLTTTINTGAAGTQITGVDAGLKNDTKGAIGDFVWNDINNNGIQDAGEPGVPGVTMTLYNVGADGIQGTADDGATLTTTTDASGYYVFPNLNAGNYVVVATPVTGYTVSAAKQGTDKTKDNNFIPGTGPNAGKYSSGVVTLLPIGSGVTRDMTVDLGIHTTAPINTLNTLGDRVWNDVNKDGLQTAGEPGVPNVTVRLLTSAGVAVNNPATGKPYVVVTDANGNYKFVDLPDGNYIVEFANLPAGYSFTGQDKDAANQGAPGSATDGATDSDAKTTTGRTAVISVDATSASATSVNIVTVDAGISQGIAAGTASLGNRVWYDVNNNGTQDAGELGVNNVKCELLDGTGAVVNVPGTSTPYVVYTNALGEYLFTGLPAGDYTVRFSRIPSGFTSSTPKAAGVDDALNADASFAGTSAIASTTATTGIYTLQTGEDNLTVDMGIVPATGTNSLGNFVWSDLNGDGLQTAGEPGVQGVTVTLYTNGADGLPGTADDVLVGVTTTDSNGAYSFVGLPDGNYNVGFSNLPAGFSFSPKDAAGFTSANGSDANQASGRTGTIALDPTSVSATGINNPDVDAGLISTRAALGNYVWLDTNGDGIQDATEKGISGVTVTLYAADGTTVLASTITDANGKYYFGNLTPGTYVVGFSTIPSNLSFTQQNTPGDNGNNTNSDADPITGKTAVITLTAGETDLTIDAGLKPNNYASVGDFVWNDLNNDGIQSAGEPGVPGIIVTLYDANTNAVIGTAVTDGNGKYLIDKIPAATAGTSYYIIFSNLPATATFTNQTSNVTPGDATLGSDANTSTGKTANFTLTPGQYLPTVDAGIKNIQLLPIKLESFTAIPKGSQVALQWIVSEQINVLNYEVEASTDGSNFKTIATQQPVNTSAAAYNVMHSNPVNGANYYRIKTTDKGGNISYSSIRLVTFGKASTVTIYPNPVRSNFVNLSLSSTMIGKAITITIISMEGKIVSNTSITKANQTEQIDINNLSSGSYILKIASSTELTNTQLQVIK